MLVFFCVWIWHFLCLLRSENPQQIVSHITGRSMTWSYDQPPWFCVQPDSMNSFLEFIHVFTVHHYHFHFLRPTGALRSLCFIRSLFQHYILKTRKTHFFKTLFKNNCGPSLKLQHVSENVYPSSGSSKCSWLKLSVAFVAAYRLFPLCWYLGEQHQQNRNQPDQHTRQMPDSAKRIKSNHQQTGTILSRNFSWRRTTLYWNTMPRHWLIRSDIPSSTV
jgi:hypothetical protein